MTFQEIKLADRRDDRFDVNHSDLRVTIHRSNGDDVQIDAVPVDISSNGIKIVTPIALHFEEPVAIEFVSTSQEGLNFTVQAEVRWFKEQLDQWIIGCATALPIPEDFIQQLCEAGGIERRRSDRVETYLEAEIEIPGYPERQTVAILDFSDTGIRFSTEIDLSKGDRIKLVMLGADEDELEVQTQVQWAQKLETSTLVGAAILANSHPKFRQQMATRAAAHLRQVGKQPWLVGALAAAAAASMIWLNII